MSVPTGTARKPAFRSRAIFAMNPGAWSDVAAATEESAGSDTSLAPDSKYAANGRRDPFISPVVSHAGGPSCTSGKKCLEIGTVNLRGIVHGQSGFIAVVSNGLNKAYFLRENDPVFNGQPNWYNNGAIVQNPAATSANSLPYYIHARNTGQAQYTQGGLIRGNTAGGIRHQQRDRPAGIIRWALRGSGHRDNGR